ncbi:3-hydroxyanthranilate 3,4-dioxygenase 2 [Marasmius oreades]|uniref:3-hydroxyanthranilate 3,4-dioxygenase 2 n=1 Tax=Marasmius oreades TaxID=181124 RepID=A0A9P7S4D7_9AGAR|nr:3-hydroxyanthranilate 3,4-dioxygenase 2 [Marasmius oreades]KAG7095070.1 3-hydroxyanthranilate 3,4-dioxygenase 2 [Marasmius oreades]
MANSKTSESKKGKCFCCQVQFTTTKSSLNVHFSIPLSVANTPHNPVRFADTIGIVMERERPEGSLDRLRWYCRSTVHDTPTIIYEEAFHVTDLGTQLKPVIMKWQQNESLRMCRHCGTIAEPN